MRRSGFTFTALFVALVIYALGWGVGLFVLGWVIQFVGHYYEGRKPAFIDDVTGLIVGPLFVVVEVGFLLGWRKDLQQAIEQRSR